MKTIKLSLALLSISIFFTKAQAQLSIGVQASDLLMLPVNNFGVGANVNVPKSERLIITAGANFYLPSKTVNSEYYNSNNSSVTPSQIEQDVTYKTTFIQIEAGIKKYFFGDYEDDFGFYGTAGAGLIIGRAKAEVSAPNPLYFGTEDGSKSILFGITLDFGIGVEKELDFGYVFSNLKANIPANTVGGSEVEFNIPTSFQLSVGVRFPIGSRY